MKNLSNILFFTMLTFFALLGVPLNPWESITPWVVGGGALITPKVMEQLEITQNKSSPRAFKTGMAMLAISVALFIGGTSLFQAQKKATMLPDPKEMDITAFEEISPRAVTKKMALKKASKVLGEKINGKNISSQFSLGSGSVILVGEKQEWVFPLEWSGIFKWMDNKAIPGFVVVSATEPEEPARLIKKEMTVSPSGYFWENLDKRIFLSNGLKGVKTHFELDEKGNPFFISVVEGTENSYSSPVVRKVIITNAVTGDQEEHEVSKTPEWVDRIVPEAYVQDYLGWNGTLKDGFINSITSKTNVETPTTYEGQELWLMSFKGQEFYVSGMTSPSLDDDSLIDFRLVNAKTMDHIIISVSGAMDEGGAIEAINSQLGANASKWQAVLPQPINVGNKLFYSATIVSKAGNLFQKMAIVDAYNPSKVFFASSIDQLKMKAIDDSENGDETVKIRKSVLKKILQKIDELEKLKDQIL